MYYRARTLITTKSSMILAGGEAAEGRYTPDDVAAAVVVTGMALEVFLRDTDTSEIDLLAMLKEDEEDKKGGA